MVFQKFLMAFKRFERSSNKKSIEDKLNLLVNLKVENISYTCRSAWLLWCKRDRETEQKKVKAKISIWHDYILPKDNRSSWLNRTLPCTAMMKTAATEIHYTFIIFINIFWSNSSKCCNNLVDFVNYKATNRRALLYSNRQPKLELLLWKCAANHCMAIFLVILFLSCALTFF